MKFRGLMAGLMLAVMTVLLANCGGLTKPTEPPQVGSPVAGTTLLAGTNVMRPTLRYTDPARTVAPASGSTLAPIIQNSTKFAASAPPFIGKWALDEKKSYVVRTSPGGVVLFYNSPGQGDIQVSYWLIHNSDIPDYNVNNAMDRFKLETSLITTPKIPVNLGDQALISPANRKPQEKTGANPTVLAILQWRNIVIDVYATPDLLKSNFDFSEAEATDFLTKMFNAIPKP